MAHKVRLNTRLWRAFLLQIALISATAAAGVYLAEFAIRELLIVSALEREADYFWARRKITTETPAPNTSVLIGYLFERGAQEAPAEFAGLDLGIHDLHTPVGTGVVHVTESDGQRLYLVFDAGNVQQLATYFGVAPLALLLAVLYTSAWVAYRIARRAVSPVIRLARMVRDVDVETPDRAALAAAARDDSVDAEIQSLAGALHQLMDRVDRYLERERNFTRAASHELRSPLTVIRMASESLLQRQALEPPARALTEKIRRAALDMEELTEVLLLLAREHDGLLPRERVEVNEILAQELARCRMIYADKALALTLESRARLCVACAPRVLGIVFGNLLHNACAYTDRGSVEVVVEAGRVVIRDSGIGIAPANLGQVFTPYFRAANARPSGHGLGLSLVKRITDRYGWRIELASQPGTGTTVQVLLPDAEVVASAPPLESPRTTPYDEVGKRAATHTETPLQP
jgi:signal transduction histidine kinase